jgi:hypothetical protein
MMALYLHMQCTTRRSSRDEAAEHEGVAECERGSHTLCRSARPCRTIVGGPAVPGCSSAHRYCPKVLFGGAPRLPEQDTSRCRLRGEGGCAREGVSGRLCALLAGFRGESVQALGGLLGMPEQPWGESVGALGGLWGVRGRP